jgi:hypothetical protein
MKTNNNKHKIKSKGIRENTLKFQDFKNLYNRGEIMLSLEKWIRNLEMGCITKQLFIARFGGAFNKRIKVLNRECKWIDTLPIIIGGESGVGSGGVIIRYPKISYLPAPPTVKLLTAPNYLQLPEPKNYSFQGGGVKLLPPAQSYSISIGGRTGLGSRSPPRKIIEFKEGAMGSTFWS